METIPEEWRKGIVKPIHKAGSINNIENYMDITLSSNVYKLYTKIIENVIMKYIEEHYVYKLYTKIIENAITKYIEEHSVLHENQGAFRKTRRLEENIY